MESEGDADVRRHEGESEEFVRTRGGGSAVRLRFRGRELGGGVRLDVGTEWRVSDRIGTKGRVHADSAWIFNLWSPDFFLLRTLIALWRVIC